MSYSYRLVTFSCILFVYAVRLQTIQTAFSRPVAWGPHKDTELAEEHDVCVTTRCRSFCTVSESQHPCARGKTHLSPGLVTSLTVLLQPRIHGTRARPARLSESVFNGSTLTHMMPAGSVSTRFRAIWAWLQVHESLNLATSRRRVRF